jgi:hypothetical protein
MNAESLDLPAASVDAFRFGTAKLEQLRKDASAHLEPLTEAKGTPQRIETLSVLERNP